MKNTTFATAMSGALAAPAVGLACPALADDAIGSVALLPGGPVTVYPQTGPDSGANPYTAFAVNPYTPYSVWAQH